MTLADEIELLPAEYPGVQSPFFQIVNLFSSACCRFILLSHPPEGNTREASRLRGHSLQSSAKTIVAVGRSPETGQPEYAILVIPGDRRVDFQKVYAMLSI